MVNLRRNTGVSKGTRFEKLSFMSALFFLLFFTHICPPVKRRHAKPAQSSRSLPVNFFLYPLVIYLDKILRNRLWRPAKLYAPLSRRFYPFFLPLPDVPALIFCHKRKRLQHNITQKCAYQVLSTPGIQKGHIQHNKVLSELWVL